MNSETECPVANEYISAILERSNALAAKSQWLIFSAKLGEQNPELDARIEKAHARFALARFKLRGKMGINE